MGIETSLAGATRAWGNMKSREPNFVDAHVGNRIRMRRQIVGVSQEKLAEMLGITFQQVQKYEKGSNRISASRLYSTARTLGVAVQFFFEDVPEGIDPGEIAEQHSADDFMSSLMNAEGITLAKAFRDAESTSKRKLIAMMARLVADSKE